MSGRWLELSTRVEREACEAVSELFARFGRGVVAEEECGLLSEEPAFTPSPFVLMKTYLPLDDEAESKRQEIERGLWVLGMIREVGPLQISTLAEKDWAEAWKTHFQVHRVGANIVIKPTWREYQPQSDDVLVELDPGMAFGTGMHPTTRLCLTLLESHVRRGQPMLDVGTGSGILAIAAGGLGARPIHAIDTDPLAVSAAQANLRTNHLHQFATVQQATLEQFEGLEGYPVIAANIIARTIIELAPLLYQRTLPGGVLIASGIIEPREPEVTEALRQTGYSELERYQEGDWVALTARRESS